MFQQDYIMRQIQMMVKVLEQVIFRKKQGRYEEAKQVAEEALGELFGENRVELSLEETLTALEKNGAFNAELAYIVADLLFERAALDGEDAEKSLMQSLLLYKKAMRHPGAAFPIDAAKKISDLEHRLGEHELKAVQIVLG